MGFSLRLSEAGWWRSVTAAAVVAAAVMVAMIRVEYVNPDTAQHVSVARNLLSGEGISTGNIYYEEQYAARALPAPQTLWPPGYPALLVLTNLIGVSILDAAFVVAIVAHCSIALLLFALGRHTGVTADVAAWGAFVWLLLAAPATLPLTAFTEPVYTAFSMLAVLTLVKGMARDTERIAYGHLILVGAAAAAAFSIRYVGVALLASLGVYFGGRYLRRPTARRLLEGLTVGVVAGAPCGYLLWRNLVLTGSLTGGPAVSQGDTNLALVLQNMVWSAATSLGVFGEHVLSHLTEAALLLTMLGALAILLKDVAKSPENVEERRSQSVLLLAGTYGVLTSLMLFTVAIDRTHELIQWRYFVPLVPFGIWAVGAAWTSYRGKVGIRGRRIGGAVLIATVALVLVSQSYVYEEWDTRFVAAEAARKVQDAAQEAVQGEPLAEYLSRNSPPDAPVLAPDGQILGALIPNPMLSLPGPYFSSRVWTDAEVARLISSYGVRWVLLIPPLFDAQSFKDSNRPFFAELAAGRSPPWLKPVQRSGTLELYAVEVGAVGLAADPVGDVHEDVRD